MEYSVLSPRGEVDPINSIGLRPRLTDLNGKTIGLFASFKEHWVLILEEIAKQLQVKYPDIKFTRFQYTKDLNSYTQVAEVAKDPDIRPEFEKWLKEADAVIVANGDAGSCTLYLTYNATLPELLGKPTVMTLDTQFINVCKRAAELRGVPALRYVEINIPDLSVEPDLTYFINEFIPKQVHAALEGIISGLTAPLTTAETEVKKPAEPLPRIAYTGNLNEINEFFYKRGWAYGMPVMPPTEEAVQEMLKGTDLPADHLVAKIPPMMGKATVEKIAINAVMAGCLPTYMPVLIAAVQGMVDPRMWLEAYTCSVASWAPLIIVNGPIRHDLNINSGTGVFSPYNKANAAIAHAMGLIIMNIAGIKSGVEDMGIFGHEGRFGICIAENEEASPWEPLHQFYGLNKEDNAVTVFWPNARAFGTPGKDVGSLLKGVCDSINVFGFDPGCAIIMTPVTARLLANEGYSRKALISYVVEYARRPAAEVPIRWLKGNHHIPKDVPLPADSSRTARKFFSSLHLPVIVSGTENTGGVALYTGGGDHGGPITKKINLPGNWNRLVEEYKGY